MKDHSALFKDWAQGHVFVSGHYHKHHTVPDTNFTYVGNPYTLTFGEANDGPKGICILNESGRLQQIPLLFRKHVVIEATAQALDSEEIFRMWSEGDLIWVKARGTAAELAALNKTELQDRLFLGQSFKFDKIVEEPEQLSEEAVADQTDSEIMDFLIDSSNEAEPLRKELKTLWRELM